VTVDEPWLFHAQRAVHTGDKLLTVVGRLLTAFATGRGYIFQAHSLEQNSKGKYPDF